MRIAIGNAEEDGRPFRQWFIGDFGRWAGLTDAAASEQYGPRHSAQVQVKWGVHAAGDERPGGWAGADANLTLSVLVSGIFVIRFDGGNVAEARLSRAGDYALWAGVPHTWVAESCATIFTVRWPG
jgi:hypothetical protein